MIIVLVRWQQWERDFDNCFGGSSGILIIVLVATVKVLIIVLVAAVGFIDNCFCVNSKVFKIVFDGAAVRFLSLFWWQQWVLIILLVAEQYGFDNSFGGSRGGRC